ncbi:MAG: hypothetical protein FWF55_01515 [Treponema sp.]|nr:hypothetical protein [Treponema sp.]
MTGVEAEINKYKTCKNRDELSMAIRQYKDLALQHAENLILAGQYTTVAHRLQEMCDKLPAPRLVKQPTPGLLGVPVKTAAISDAEQAKIDAEWKKKTKR